MLKKVLEKEFYKPKAELQEIKRIPCGHNIYHCPECGNPILLNVGQEKFKNKDSQSFYCSSGHKWGFVK